MEPVKLKAAVIALFVATLAGCATMGGKVVKLTYASTLEIAGGSGDLYLVKPKPAEGDKLFVVGVLKNNVGEKIGDAVTEIPPSELLFRAYEDEFRNSGYTVKVAEAIPADAAKGIEFLRLDIALEQNTSILRLDAASRVTSSAVVYKDGKKVTKVDYEASYADATAGNRDVFLEWTLLKATESLMKQSVPELMKLLNDKPKKAPKEADYIAPSPPPPASGEPLPPTALTVLPAPEGIYLVWQNRPQPGAVTGYEIHRAEGEGPFAPLAAVEKGTSHYHDKTAVSGRNYRYKVRAMAGSVGSAFSDEVKVQR